MSAQDPGLPSTGSRNAASPVARPDDAPVARPDSAPVILREERAAGSTAPDGLRRDVRATLMPGFSGFTAPEWVLAALGDGLLATCVYGGNVRDREQLAALGAQLRAAAPDAIIAIDEEGGEVTRLHYLEGAPYPGAAILGRIDDLAYTEEIGRRVGRDILASGFDLALAPDADVNSNPRNPVIGTRSFGSDPARAAAHVAAWVRGLRSTGAKACPKHFPGHGDTAQDSHLALPVVDAPLDVLVERDLPPFAAAIAAGAETVMTSHILLPEIDPDRPATFSRDILQGLLRDRLGFTGAIVSDALDMQGASGGIGIPEAAARALAAGCDLLCIGTDTTAEQLREIEDRVLSAVAEGRLPESRVRDAAARVRALLARRADALPQLDRPRLDFPPVERAQPDLSQVEHPRPALPQVERAQRVETHAGPSHTPPASGQKPPSAHLPGTVFAHSEQAPAAPAPADTRAELARIADSFDGADAARAWLAAHPGAAVLRVDSEANMAVGFAPWGPFAAAAHPRPEWAGAAASFDARATATVGDTSPMPWPLPDASAADRGVIVVGRELHRHEFARDGIDALRDGSVPALVIEMGWPETPVGGARGYADLATFGSSALAGAALLALIDGACADPEPTRPAPAAASDPGDAA